MTSKFKYILVVGALIAGSSAAYFYKARAAKLPAKEAKAATAPEPMKVRVITMKPAPFIEKLSSTGTVRADEAVELQVEVSGKVTSINFQEGGPVKKGDLLLKINDSELRAQFMRATYRKQIAELKEKRLASLLQGGGVPQQDYDTALNELNVQNAEMELIAAQIAKTEVRAPFDGVVGIRFVSEGAYITATSTAAVRIATLQAIDRMKIDFNLPEKYSGRIKVGAPITFSVSGGDSRFKGEVYAIEPRIDVATRTMLLRALCADAKGQLLSGSFASVECALPAIEDALFVPALAVVPGLNKKTVFVIKEGKAEQRAIEAGTRTESMVQVLSGLKAGEQVIVSNLQQLRAGLAVQAATPGSSSGKPVAASPVVAPGEPTATSKKAQ